MLEGYCVVSCLVVPWQDAAKKPEVKKAVDPSHPGVVADSMKIKKLVHEVSYRPETSQSDVHRVCGWMLQVSWSCAALSVCDLCSPRRSSTTRRARRRKFSRRE